MIRLLVLFALFSISCESEFVARNRPSDDADSNPGFEASEPQEAGAASVFTSGNVTVRVPEGATDEAYAIRINRKPTLTPGSSEAELSGGGRVVEVSVVSAASGEQLPLDALSAALTVRQQLEAEIDDAVVAVANRVPFEDDYYLTDEFYTVEAAQSLRLVDAGDYVLFYAAASQFYFAIIPAADLPTGFDEFNPTKQAKRIRIDALGTKPASSSSSTSSSSSSSSSSSTSSSGGSGAAGTGKLALGGGHACSLRDGGKVVCWGRGANGELGYGNTNVIGDDEHPKDNPANPDGAGPSPYVATSATILSIEAFAASSCAVLADGSAQCWGTNTNGIFGWTGGESFIGDNELPRSKSPITLQAAITAISIGNEHACALDSEGRVYCWGDNSYGQLGYGNAVGTGGAERAANVPPEATLTVPLGETAIQVIAGYDSTCALLASGNVKCWGQHGGGRLGYKDLSQDLGDDETPDSYGYVVLGQSAKGLSAGVGFYCALLEDGGVTCWGTANYLGRNHDRVIGDDEHPSSDSDYKVPIGERVVQIDSETSHSCAVTESGKVKCWGEDFTAQDRLGDGQGTYQFNANVYVDLRNDRKAKAVAVGAANSCVVYTDDSVGCWGNSSVGMYGLPGYMIDPGNPVPLQPIQLDP